MTEVYKAERIGADWSTAEKQGKLVVVVSIKASLEQFISLFTARKNRLSILQTTHKFSFLTLRFPSRKTVGNNFFFTNKNYFATLIHFLSNRSSGVQIPRDICTRFERCLYSRKCSWIMKVLIP